jgi:hypothetical protein
MRTTAALSGREQASVPPYRLMQTRGYVAKLGVLRIDEEIVLEPGNDARHSIGADRRERRWRLTPLGGSYDGWR